MTPNPYAPAWRRMLGQENWQGPPEGALTVAPHDYDVTAYTLDSVPGTAKEVIAWVDDATSDEDMIARAEAAREANLARPKAWATVTASVDKILG